MKSLNKILPIIYVIISVGIAILSASKVNEHKLIKIENDYKIQLENKDTEILSLNNIIEDKNKVINNLHYERDELELKAISRRELLTEQNEILDILLKREELYDKSEIAVMNTCNKRTDMTYEEIEHLVETCEEKSLPYELFTYIIKLESNFNPTLESNQSSATGYMQVIEGTGRYTYEKVMGNPPGSYNHSMALDPKMNITLALNYFEYLFGRADEDVEEVLKRYSGFYSPYGIGYKYFDILDNHMDKFDYSISKAQLEYNRLNN